MKITIKQNILKKLRASRSIPLEAMPDKLKMTQEEYGKFENSDTEVDIKTASKIAGAFGRNWSVFLLDDVEEKYSYKRDNRTEENRASTLNEKTIIAIEDANYILEFSKDLSSHRGITLSKRKRLKALSSLELGSEIRKLSNISIENQKKFKNISVALKKWIEYIESIGIFVSQYPLSELDKVRAFSLSNEKMAVIVLNTNDTHSGRIFSLIHELGHIIKNSTGICDMHRSPSGEEVFCNAFASEFLTPTKFVIEYINTIGEEVIISNLENYAKKLSGILKVSPLVIYRKFKTLGLISNAEYSKIHMKHVSLFQKFKKKPKKEGRGGPNYYDIKKLRNGSSYSNKVVEAFKNGEVSIIEASKGLNIGMNNLNEYVIRSA